MSNRLEASPSSADIRQELWETRIDKEADIVEVRQRVRDLAKELKFDQFAVAALTTAASELSRNVWVHAQKGVARIRVLRSGRRVGLELEFVDQGPGIADLNRALAGGFSTAKSLGLGLSGTKRLVDEFDIDTAPGRGTKVVIRKWKKEF
jgi:serine/threonine-protein kinase RsbT